MSNKRVCTRFNFGRPTAADIRPEIILVTGTTSRPLPNADIDAASTLIQLASNTTTATTTTTTTTSSNTTTTTTPTVDLTTTEVIMIDLTGDDSDDDSVATLILPPPPPGLVECLVIIRTVAYTPDERFTFVDKTLLLTLNHVQLYLDFYPTQYYSGGRLMLKLYDETHDRITRHRNVCYGRMPFYVPLCSYHNVYVGSDDWFGDWEDITEDELSDSE